MAKQPIDMVPEMLRGIRATLDKQGKTLETHGKVLDSIAKEAVNHTMRLESIEERFELLREGTVSAIGFAAHADRQYKGVKHQLAELFKRVEMLEKSR